MVDAHQVELPQVEPADELYAQRPWEAVHISGGDCDDDRRALEALCATVPTKLGASITNKAMAKLAWDAITAAHVGRNRVRRATL